MTDDDPIKSEVTIIQTNLLRLRASNSKFADPISPKIKLGRNCMPALSESKNDWSSSQSFDSVQWEWLSYSEEEIRYVFDDI